ncbi:MAG: ATP-binding protein, partial [Gammaproteobacteria bacterium]|nr:ATP-binding protein [Gammaproteobacteria bacterium]NNJ84186.1 ATP-binding protein [Gammaproteobacteria bacterium]
MNQTVFSYGDDSPEHSKISHSRLPCGAVQLIGRESELALLDNALAEPLIHIVQLVAWGGVGKTALAADWMARLAANGWCWESDGYQNAAPDNGASDNIARIRRAQHYFDWSFHGQGARDQGSASSDTFIAAALEFFGDPDPQFGSPHERGTRLARLIARQPAVLILDGVESLQYGDDGPLAGQLKDPALLALLKGLAYRITQFPGSGGLCLVTTRTALTDLDVFQYRTVIRHDLEHLDRTASAALLHQAGAVRCGAAAIVPDNAELQRASREVMDHALTLKLLGGYLQRAHGGDIDRRDRVRLDKADQSIQGAHAFLVIAAYERWLGGSLWDRLAGLGARLVRFLLPTVPRLQSLGFLNDAANRQRMVAILRLLGLFDRPAT